MYGGANCARFPPFPPMKKLLAVLLFAFPFGLNAQESAQRLVRETIALTPQEEQTRLHVPAGFEVHLFASEPMINKPINMAFDAKGRLWVSSTVEYPYAASKDRWTDDRGSQVKGSRDAIKILEDTDGDGAADKATDFATGLNIPTGVLPWHKPEHRDGCIAWSIPNIWYFADTDGDGRADLSEVLFGPLGYEKDTHGMCSSFRLGGDGWVYATHGFNNTSHFEAKDGSTLDLHSGNVFRFRPDGSHIEIWSWGQVNPFGLCWDRRSNLYSADCHSNPITQLLRGAYYPSFGKPHDGLGYGPVMCQHSHGSTGLCGIVYLDGGVWGPDWDDHMLLGNCVTSKINHDHITFTGSTPKANEQPDFLTSDDLWFRPVDLQLGPDNALYIADFYNKIIGHYEVPLDHPGRDKERGRIWRIVKKGTDHATRAALVLPPQPGIDDLASSDPHAVRRAAAWFAEHPAPAATPKLWASLSKVGEGDLQLRHQLRIAIREHLKLPGAYTSVDRSHPVDLIDLSLAVPTEQAAQFLLQQWPQDDVNRLLNHLARYAAPDTLKQAIAKARGTSPRQISQIEALANGLLERGIAPPAELLEWATELAKTLLAEDGAEVSTWAFVGTGENPWCIQDRTTTDGQNIQVLSSLNHDLQGPEKLTGTLRSQPFAAPAKLSFWICGHQGFPNQAANERNLVRLVDEKGAVLQQAFPPRHNDARLIEWDLTASQGSPVHFEIIDGDDGKAYAWLGVGRFSEPALSIDRFQSDARHQKDLRTLATILRTTAPIGLRDQLAEFLPQAAPLPQNKPQPEVDALIKQRSTAFATAKGDPAKGAQLFTTHCAICHTLGGQGGMIGPQLDGINKRGADRIIEDILDPYRNIDTHFRLHQITRRDGTTAAGFMRGEVGQVILLVDAAGAEQRISKGDITEDKELPQSLMPPIFGQTLSEADFADLVGYLMTR